MRHWLQLLWVALGAVFLIVAMPPQGASADAAGPTDYRTVVLGIEPEVPGMTVDIVGGDSFVRLQVDPGRVVEVLGYGGEPFLRFEVDGTVRRNERSPTRWLSDDRYGEVELPAEADAEAEPRWVVVAGSGSHLWHDHRAHWMNEQQPPGAEPGDVVLEAVIPLLVDGSEVDVLVQSVLLAPPDLRPVVPIVGALGAGALAAALRRRRMLVVVVAATAGLAGIVGVWSYLSMPSETQPSAVPWIVPIVALVALGVAALVARGSGPRDSRADILLGFAGFELVLWGWLQRAALLRASLPTSAPHWFERGVVGGAGVVGLVAVASVMSMLTHRGRGAH